MGFPGWVQVEGEARKDSPLGTPRPSPQPLTARAHHTSSMFSAWRANPSILVMLQHDLQDCGTGGHAESRAEETPMANGPTCSVFCPAKLDPSRTRGQARRASSCFVLVLQD
jgi:hypothetical protein